MAYSLQKNGDFQSTFYIYLFIYFLFYVFSTILVNKDDHIRSQHLSRNT